MPKILIVDDQAIVRFGTEYLIHESFSSAQVDVACDANEMVSRLLAKTYDLILLDIQIPGGNNFSMLDIIRLRQPNVKILIFSGYSETIYAQRYISEGAHGFVSKLYPQIELQKAIRAVLQGEIYLSQNIKMRLYETGSNDDAGDNLSPFHSLSNRELEVTNLMMEGLAAMEISVRLNLQLSTVSTYKKRVFDKLNVANVVGLIEKSRYYNYM